MTNNDNVHARDADGAERRAVLNHFARYGTAVKWHAGDLVEQVMGGVWRLAELSEAGFVVFDARGRHPGGG